MYWLGGYETAKATAFATQTKPGTCVFDIGAQAGYYSLIAARKVGPNGNVVAFEPLPRNLDYLRRNVQINGLENVSVIESAVDEKDGEAFFHSDNPSTGRLADHGLKVRTVALDAGIERGDLRVPSLMKIDVEGAEFQVLSGAERLLREEHPTVFLATHGAEVHGKCLALLRDCGYHSHLLAEDEVVATANKAAYR